MDGFDPGPGEFYLSSLAPPQPLAGQVVTGDAATHVANPQIEYRAAQTELQKHRLETTVAEVAGTLAERGWTLVTLDNGPGSRGFSSSAEHTGHEKVAAFKRTDRVMPGSATLPHALFLQPRAPLAQLAESTGGDVAGPGDSLGGVLAAVSRAYLVTYQVARPADGRLHTIEIATSRGGTVVRAPGRVLSGTSLEESEARVVGLLGGATSLGDLDALLLLDTGESPAGHRLQGRVEVRTRMAALQPALEALGSARVRVTVGVAMTGAAPFVYHDERILHVADAAEYWVWDAPIDWPSDAGTLAVVVEELATGAWGGAVTELPAR